MWLCCCEVVPYNLAKYNMSNSPASLEWTRNTLTGGDLTNIHPTGIRSVQDSGGDVNLTSGGFDTDGVKTWDVNTGFRRTYPAIFDSDSSGNTYGFSTFGAGAGLLRAKKVNNSGTQQWVSVLADNNILRSCDTGSESMSLYPSGMFAFWHGTDKDDGSSYWFMMSVSSAGGVGSENRITDANCVAKFATGYTWFEYIGGDFVIVGDEAVSTGAGSGVLMQAVDTSASIQWEYPVDTDYTQANKARYKNGSIYLHCEYLGDWYIEKITTAGAFVSRIQVPGYLSSFDVDSSENYYCAEFIPSTPLENGWIKKYNSSGTLQWTITVGPRWVAVDSNDVLHACGESIIPSV